MGFSSDRLEFYILLRSLLFQLWTFSFSTHCKKIMKKFADLKKTLCIFKIVRESNFVGGKFKSKFLSSINLPWGHERSDPHKIWARSVQPFWRLLETYPDRQKTVLFCIQISFFKIEKNNLFLRKKLMLNHSSTFEKMEIAVKNMS